MNICLFCESNFTKEGSIITCYDCEYELYKSWERDYEKWLTDLYLHKDLEPFPLFDNIREKDE